jgi:hypothetical protein
MKRRARIRMVALRLALGGALALVARPSPACGGPDMGEFAALAPLGETLDSILTTDDAFAPWGQEQRPEFRFLYPFWKAHPRELEELWRFSYADSPPLAGPVAAPLDAALARGDVAEGVRQATGILDAVYAMPPAIASSYAALFWRAVEVIELEPQLHRTQHDVIARFFGPAPLPADASAPLRAASAARQAHDMHAPLPPAAGNPRAASLEYWTFQDHLKTRIPDGWSDALRKSVSPTTWTDLEGEADAWIARHPTHPLADLARLAKVRIFYFAGDFDAAWDQALSLYPRRRVRALAEMRYLLLQGHTPSAAFVARLTDPELTTALLLQDGFDASRWEALWRASETMLPGDVRVNLQERLLAWQAANTKPGALPASFPGRPSNPSALWGKLRAIALLRAGESDRALDQLQTLAADPERDLLLAQADLQAGRPDRAVEIPRLSRDARAYLLGARIDDSTVSRLCQNAVPAARAAACFELAIRTARAGRWSDAIPFVRVGMPNRAARWEEVARLAAAPSADRDLALARFFDRHPGEVVSIADSGPYRGISMVDERLPARSPEHARVGEMLMRTTERWLALENYVRWLAQNRQAPAARAVLDEADRAYNGLVNYGGSDSYFWARWAPITTTVADLRRLGAAIRKRSAGKRL